MGVSRRLNSFIPAAMRNENVGIDDKWRYFCGIVWRTLDKIEAGALDPTGTSPPDEEFWENYVRQEWYDEMRSDDAVSR